MNHSEEVTEMAELHLPSGEYCFAYVDENITVQVSTRGAEPIVLVSAFVSYMKALQFDPEAIESALYKVANTMKSFRMLGSVLESKE